jgi:homoserine dehydrogenase
MSKAHSTQSSPNPARPVPFSLPGAAPVRRPPDIVDIAHGAVAPAFGRPARDLETTRPAPENARAGAFYLRFQALDQPGVLAEIAARLARAQVSIESMIQRGRAFGESVAIVMITHPCTPMAVEAALKDIVASDKILGAPTLIHMEPG